MGIGPFKVSMMGDVRSGRSSIVAALSGKPCPNHPGIQVSRWRSAAGILLELWDVNSRSTLESLGQTFLAHAQGLVAVADLSRPESLIAARHALDAAFAMIGRRPAVLLLNGRAATPASDLLRPPGVAAEVAVHQVNARTGAGVAAAFEALATRLGAARPALQTQSKHDVEQR